MRSKPILAKLIAAGLFLVPVVLFLRLELARRQYQLSYTPQNLTPILIFSLTAITIAYGVWKVRMWGFLSLFFYGLLSAGWDLSYIFQAKMKFTYWTAIDLSACFIGLGLIVQKKIRAPYFNPKIRWWEQATRYRVDIRGKFFVGDQMTEAAILDISTSGCFADLPLNVSPTDLIRVEIAYKETVFTTEAQFVRKSESPRGIGLKFINTNPQNGKTIRRLLSSLVKKEDIVR